MTNLIFKALKEHSISAGGAPGACGTPEGLEWAAAALAGLWTQLLEKPCAASRQLPIGRTAPSSSADRRSAHDQHIALLCSCFQPEFPSISQVISQRVCATPWCHPRTPGFGALSASALSGNRMAAARTAGGLEAQVTQILASACPQKLVLESRKKGRRNCLIYYGALN